MPRAARSEEKHAMRFLQLNAGVDGVHHPGNTHEIGDARAALLADDEVAHYAAEDMQSQHDEEVKRAAEVNARRARSGLGPMPIRQALAPGAETADYRPGHPMGGPIQPVDWRQLQIVVDALRRAEEQTVRGREGDPHSRGPVVAGHDPRGAAFRDPITEGGPVEGEARHGDPRAIHGDPGHGPGHGPGHDAGRDHADPGGPVGIAGKPGSVEHPGHVDTGHSAKAGHAPDAGAKGDAGSGGKGGGKGGK